MTPFIGSTAQTPQTFSTTATSVPVTGLTGGETYTFKVAAITAAGTGPQSAASNAVLAIAPITAPGVPTGVTASAGVGTATVSWTAPASNGGAPINTYIVTAIRDGAAQSNTTFDGTATTRTISGLTLASTYTFTVRAGNAIATGGASDPSNAVSPCRCIKGRVVDNGTGTGLPGVRVRAIAGTLGAEATSAADGTYVLNVPSATAAYRIQFADKTSPVERFPLQYRTVGGTEKTEVAGASGLLDRIVLRQTIAGNVLDLAGAPLAHVRVRAIDSAGKLAAEATTDATGVYVLKVPSPTAGYKIQFADKYNPTALFELQYRTVAGAVAIVTAASPPLEDRISVKRAITGVVIDGITGQPVAGLRLRALKPTLAAEAISAPDGTFTLNGLDTATTYTVQVADKRAVPVYPIRWYANSVNQAGAQTVAVGSHITFVVWPS